MFACLLTPLSVVRGRGAVADRATAKNSATADTATTVPRLLAVARTCSPRVDAHAEHLVTLDVEGLQRLFGSSQAVGERLRRAAADHGIAPVHVAIAATRTAAMLLASARAGITVVAPGDEAAALAPLPLRTLDVLCDPQLLAVLSRWGIRTLGQLAALPPVEVSERLGQIGVRWQRWARGEDAGPLVPTPEDEPFEAALQLEWPIEGLEPLSFVLGGLLDPLCQRLERRDRAAAVLHLRLRLVTRDVHARSLQLPAPMRDPKVLRTLLLLDLESHPAPAAIDIVTVTIEPTPGRIVQESLLTRALPAPEQISTLLARLGALVGSTRCGSPALVDSHRPGAFAMTPFCVPDASNRIPRPQSLIPSVSLRRFRLPIPARVLVDQGRPLTVRTDRQGLPGGRVHACAGPWRSSGEWWKTGPAHSSPGLERLRGHTGWHRDEWDVALGDGGIYRIFEDRDSGRWFVEAIVD